MQKCGRHSTREGDDMSKKNPGQKIGVACPVCHEGKLLVRITHIRHSNGAIGGRGIPNQQNVKELACSNCCLKFTAEDEGKSIWSLLENSLQLAQATYDIKAEKPRTCPRCENDTLKEAGTALASDHENWGPLGGVNPNEHKRTRYLYCNDCLTVVHILYRPTTPEIIRASERI